ncbi:SRPBCC family protein [Sphingobacterium arenae]|uniref:SRPBCC family protein n=1 Tax=Sphingobacterium arenae TaxID=1280598 RepID=A0ABR7Y2Z8_9SPHI|nr:SRPBCC family protein [Sphingobacterium arenae]MBD1425685.1 SRPBCC family protein [Sphingobacterium arenae]
MENSKTKITAEVGKQEIFIIREFDAKPELVFQAHTEPDLLVQWMGLENHTMEIATLENKNFGAWRFIHTDESGNSFGFNGVIHETDFAKRIIRTFEFEGLPEKGHVSLEFLNFEALPNDRTKLTTQVIFKSIEDRDAMIQSGMEHGVVDSYNKLDNLLSKR